MEKWKEVDEEEKRHILWLCHVWAKEWSGIDRAHSLSTRVGIKFS